MAHHEVGHCLEKLLLGDGKRLDAVGLAVSQVYDMMTAVRPARRGRDVEVFSLRYQPPDVALQLAEEAIAFNIRQRLLMKVSEMGAVV